MPPDVPPKPARICLSYAISTLKMGPLGIGETHTEVHGRELVQQLLDCGVVVRLFVELPTYGGIQATTVEKAQQALVKGDVERAKDLARSVGTYESPANAAPRLGDLVYLALARNIPVIIADPASARGYSNNAVRRRNKATVEVFKQATGAAAGNDPRAMGSLLLFGSDHFRGPGSLCLLLPGLKWICTSGRSG